MDSNNGNCRGTGIGEYIFLNLNNKLYEHIPFILNKEQHWLMLRYSALSWDPVDCAFDLCLQLSWKGGIWGCKDCVLLIKSLVQLKSGGCADFTTSFVLNTENDPYVGFPPYCLPTTKNVIFSPVHPVVFPCRTENAGRRITL